MYTVAAVQSSGHVCLWGSYQLMPGSKTLTSPCLATRLLPDVNTVCTVPTVYMYTVQYICWIYIHAWADKSLRAMPFERKNIKQILISNFLWSKRKVFVNFQNKILIFKVPVFFWKWNLCCVCAARARQNSLFFGIGLKKFNITPLHPTSQ